MQIPGTLAVSKSFPPELTSRPRGPCAPRRRAWQRERLIFNDFLFCSSGTHGCGHLRSDFFFFFCKTEQIILKNDQILPVRHWPPPEPGHQVRFCSSGTSAQPAVCPGDRARISAWTPNPGVKLGREWRPAFQSRRPVWPRPCRAELPLSRLEAWTRGDGRPARTKSGCRSGLWKRGSGPRELHSLERNEIETRTVHTS